VDSVALVGAIYAPNAPFLISPKSFGGAGTEAVAALRGMRLGTTFRPTAIVVSSPHWLSRPGFLVQVSAKPPQIFDFSGMPRTLIETRYRPPGDPPLARALVAAIERAGLPVQGTDGWGLDHGAWAPLMHLLPEGQVPVVPISISSEPPRTHLALGRAIRPVLEDWPGRIVFLATGSITHDFARMDPIPGARWPEGERIEDEILELVKAREDEALVEFDRAKWRLVQPEGELAPLFTLLGAVDPSVHPRLVHRSSAMGGFGMSILEFAPG
jgi:4,5-DOPA dioxygenase extradiol